MLEYFQHIGKYLTTSFVFYLIINFVFQAVFFDKTKANISLLSTAFCYEFIFFNKFALFEILGILGWSKLQ